MEEVSLKIGERLKEIRNTRQLTLDDVAELTGVSKPMLGQIERGQSSPTINNIVEDFNRAENTVILFLQTGGSGIYGRRAWRKGYDYGRKWEDEGIPAVPF